MKSLAYIISWLLLFEAMVCYFSSWMYALQSPPDERWFSRMAVSFILFGLWLIQYRIQKLKTYTE